MPWWSLPEPADAPSSPYCLTAAVVSSHLSESDTQRPIHCSHDPTLSAAIADSEADLGEADTEILEQALPELQHLTAVVSAGRCGKSWGPIEAGLACGSIYAACRLLSAHHHHHHPAAISTCFCCTLLPPAPA